jgi:hypothetical protein
VALLSSNFSRPFSPKPGIPPKAVELFASAGVVGAATYDGWVALAASDNRALLATRKGRAEGTCRRLGVDVEVLT